MFATATATAAFIRRLCQVLVKASNCLRQRLGWRRRTLEASGMHVKAAAATSLGPSINQHPIRDFLSQNTTGLKPVRQQHRFTQGSQSRSWQHALGFDL